MPCYIFNIIYIHARRDAETAWQDRTINELATDEIASQQRGQGDRCRKGAQGAHHTIHLPTHRG